MINHSLIASRMLLVAVASIAFRSTALAQQPAKAQPAKPAAKTPASKSAPSIEQFMKIRAPNSPTLAPDGTLYVRDWPDGVNQLYKRDARAPAGAPMTRLTDFPDGLNSYALSHDGKRIILSAATGGSEQHDLYLLEAATGEIKPLLVNPKVVYDFQLWLRDDSGFIYTANDENSADFHMYRYDLASATPTKLLAKAGQWGASDIAADGLRLLVYEYLSESRANAFELSPATGALAGLNVGGDETYNMPAMYLPGETTAVIISDTEEGITRVFVRDLRTGNARKPLPQLDPFPVEGGAVNEQRTLAAVLVNEGGYGTMNLVRLPSFEPVPMPEIEQGVIGALDIRGGTVTYSLSNSRTPGLSYALRADSTSDPVHLTTADTQGIDLSQFTLPQLISYTSFDGTKIPAFIYTPPGYTPGAGKAIPFVANYHGGPEGQHRPGFSALTQYLLANGYGVIQPNVRGSTGYGREFHMMDNYKHRWDSVRDGVEAARWLVKNGYSATGKIAAYGGSYGGFMAVACAIEGADVFGASVDVVGIVNFKTFLEQTKDYRRKLREAEYGPLSDPEFLASISPLNRIHQIKAPMLIAHGLNDPRVPVGEAMQLAVGLQKRGYDPELLFFPDEGHGFAKLDNRLLFAKRMVKFLQKTIAN